MSTERTYGAEIEKPVSTMEGEPHRVSQEFFDRLAVEALRRGSEVKLDLSTVAPGIALGVQSEIGEQGLDNGLNLLESALNYQTTLSDLDRVIRLDLATVQRALEAERASVSNLSIHPLGSRDKKTYQANVAPKAIYPYIWSRGWDHTAGIDAKAQNSPTTGVEAYEAADAVSVIIGTGAAFVSLFANSPAQEGKLTGYKETRLTMWERMMKNAKVSGDRTVAQFPAHRFRTMAEYFNWMFGNDTGIHFVVASEGNKAEYKNIGDRILIIDGNPPVLEYLSQESWTAHYLNDLLKGVSSNSVMVTPNISHMETMQFAQFAGARIRYSVNEHSFPVNDFLRACAQPHLSGVEDIFSQHAKYLYIEGRDPGANFPDASTRDSLGTEADTVTISPSVIQAGLIRNLSEAKRFIDSHDWNHLNALREAAVKDGLHGEAGGVQVYDFAQAVLEIAARGLTSDEQKLLAYPQKVLQMRQNGADRALKYLDEFPGSLAQALVSLVKQRQVVA